MSGAQSRLAAFCVLIALQVPSLACAQAGPPFLTNDPGTPGSGNWEINIASAQSINRRSADYQVPQIDLNFGVGDRVQLTYEMPYVIHTENGQPSRSGWSNAYPGVKWRFLDRGDGDWQAAVFPQLETNGLASAREKDIAAAGPRWLLPVEVTKRWGSIDFDVEAGYYLPRNGVRERILGLAAGRAVSDRFELAAEVYNDRVFSTALNETTVDLGGRCKLARGFIALFMVGHSVGGTADGPQFIGYVGIQILLSDDGRALQRAETHESI